MKTGTTPSKKLQVVYLGELGFPVGLAPIQKCRLLSRALIENGARVTVLGRMGTHDRASVPGLRARGEFEGIEYHVSSGTPYRPKSVGARLALIAAGLINEIRHLVRLRRAGRFDVGLLSVIDFPLAVFYGLIAKTLRAPLVLLLVEHGAALDNRTSLGQKMGDRLFDKTIRFFVDGFLPISEYLVEFVKRCAPGKPYLKIPVLADFDLFAAVHRRPGPPTFLFCSSAAYPDVVAFVLAAFEALAVDEAELVLVVSGRPGPMGRIRAAVNRSPRSRQIRLLSNLSETELIRRYVDASGLLIPLRPTRQDQARFPHKIGEYTASGNPIITTAVGEIPLYFEDGQSAFIARDYDPGLFAEKMRLVMERPDEARRVGEAGRRVGIANFDYRKYGPPLLSFLNDVVRSRKNNRRPERI